MQIDFFREDSGLVVQRLQNEVYGNNDPDAWPLGLLLFHYVNLASEPRTREEVLQRIRAIRVFRNLRSVHIDYADGTNETFEAAPEIWLEAEERTRRAPVLSLTIAPSQIVLELADVVLHTRAERRRLKLPEPSFDDTLRALGFPILEQPSEEPAATGALESEAPVPLQRKPAPYADPPRDDHEARTTNTPEASGKRETSQGSSGAGPLSSGPKPSSKRKLR
jgi:hypothetical protein